MDEQPVGGPPAAAGAAAGDPGEDRRGDRRLPWEIALRYLRGRSRKRSRLLDGTARAALAATAIGVAAMVIAMALMTGYRQELQRKLIGANAAVVAYPLGAGQTIAEAELAALRALPGVIDVRPVAFGQGIVTSAAVPAGVEVSVRGVEPGAVQLGDAHADLVPGADGVARVALGGELMAELKVKEGDIVRFAALGLRDGAPRFAYLSLRVAGRFATGFSEFDRRWGVMDRARLAETIGEGSGASFYEFRLADPERAGDLAADLDRRLGSRFVVSSWRDLNGELFAALGLQQVMLFLVLGLIVLVSTFNVASTLVVLVRERMREVGVLSALGLGPAAVRRVFLLYGGFLGLVGILLGLGIGVGASWALETFHLIRFGPEVAAIYFLDSVPFHVRALDLAAIVGFALVVNLLACLLPAVRAARVEPAAALRYE